MNLIVDDNNILANLIIKNILFNIYNINIQNLSSDNKLDLIKYMYSSLNIDKDERMTDLSGDFGIIYDSNINSLDGKYIKMKKTYILINETEPVDNDNILYILNTILYNQCIFGIALIFIILFSNKKSNLITANLYDNYKNNLLSLINYFYTLCKEKDENDENIEDFVIYKKMVLYLNELYELQLNNDQLIILCDKYSKSLENDKKHIVWGKKEDIEYELQNLRGKTGGKKKTIYKSTGKKIKIQYNKKILERVIYVNKRNTKFIKINNEFNLLSKYKIIK